MSDEQLDDIRHVARREAAPFVLIAAVAAVGPGGPQRVPERRILRILVPVAGQ